MVEQKKEIINYRIDLFNNVVLKHTGLKAKPMFYHLPQSLSISALNYFYAEQQTLKEYSIKQISAIIFQVMSLPSSNILCCLIMCTRVVQVKAQVKA